MLPFALVLQLSGVAPPPAPAPSAHVQVHLPIDDEQAAPARGPTPTRGFASGFGRFQIGLGPPSFSPETSLLRLEGYGGSKLWLELDGGTMIGGLGRHVGVGVWAGFGRWFSPGNARTPALTEVDYLLGIELPVRFGTRDLALFAAPRVGIVSGSLDLGGESPSHQAFVGGAQVGAVSSRYHLSASMSYLSGRFTPVHGIGREQDLGGLYFSVGVLLDDG
ncbi:MAG: hypothetical protein ABJE95_27040 [Byssovorax sp.]